MLKQVTAYNINVLLREANNMGIVKDQIVQVMNYDGRFFLIYEE